MTIAGRIGLPPGVNAPPPPSYEGEESLTAGEVARRLGGRFTAKRVHAMPIKRVRLGHRTVRYLWSDVVAYLRSRAG